MEECPYFVGIIEDDALECHHLEEWFYGEDW